MSVLWQRGLHEYRPPVSCAQAFSHSTFNVTVRRSREPKTGSEPERTTVQLVSQWAGVCFQQPQMSSRRDIVMLPWRFGPFLKVQCETEMHRSDHQDFLTLNLTGERPSLIHRSVLRFELNQHEKKKASQILCMCKLESLQSRPGCYHSL